QDPEFAVEQKIAAVKADVITVVEQRGAMAAILAEHAGEDMDGRQDTLVAAVGEGRAIAAVVAEIAVDHLPFEDVADHVAAVAAAALHHDVAQAEVIEILPAGHVAGQQDAVPVAARSLDVQSLQQEKAEG